MAIEDLYAQQQSYGGSKVDAFAKLGARIKSNRESENLTPIDSGQAPTQLSSVMTGIVNKMALDKRTAEVTARQNAMDNALTGNGLGGAGMGMYGSGSENVSPVTSVVLNGKSGPGTRNQVKNVVINSADPLDKEVFNIANENLKYSQGRGKGCTDCSATTQRMFKKTYGINIGGNTESQWAKGKSVAPGSEKAGDLVYFKSPKTKYKNRNVTHVGKYNGDGTMTHFGLNGLATVPLKGYSLPRVGFKRFI